MNAPRPEAVRKALESVTLDDRSRSERQRSHRYAARRAALRRALGVERMARGGAL